MEIADDAFWLEYAKSTIQNSITTRNEAASKLEKMTLWFWGLYTASFTIGVSINLIDAPTTILVLLALPVFTLIITYWLCVRAQFPVTAEYDPVIPIEIKDGFNRGLKIKNRRFQSAVISTLISAFLLGFALFSLSFVKKKETKSMIVCFNDSKNLVVVSGIVPKDSFVTTTADSTDGNGNKIIFYRNVFKVQENGILNINVPLKTVPKEIYVSCLWKEDGMEKGFVQKLIK